MPANNLEPEGEAGEDRSQDRDSVLPDSQPGGTIQHETVPHAAVPHAGETGAMPEVENATASIEENNKRFTAWRRQRPFGAGLVMILAGVVIMTPAYLSFEISNIQVQISTISGVSTLIIGVLLITCGLLTWFRGEGRILTGVVSLILGLVALPTTNFGGFVLGTTLALIGGALALSWTEEEKEPKEKKKRKKAVAGGAVIAVVATMLGIAAVEPSSAEAGPLGLPNLQDVIPFLPGSENPDPAASEKNKAENNDRANLNERPGFPSLSAVPGAEEALKRGEEILRGEFFDKHKDAPLPEIPGIDLAPPEPIGWTVPPSGNLLTVKADKTTLMGNVKFSYVAIDTAQGPREGIRIDADHAILDNLSVRFPGDASGVSDVWMRTGPGEITSLNDNFHIIVRALEVTPQVEGVTSPIPLKLSADMPPAQLKKMLHTLGLGTPDELSSRMVMLNGTMDSYYISSDNLIGSPATTVGE